MRLARTDRPRGLVGPVMAMARPKRPSAERELVIAATERMTGSARARASRLARQVAREAAAFVDREPGDLSDALLLAEAVIAPSPAFLLATVADVNTAALFIDARARRYIARGCQQLSPAAWAAETAELTAELGEVLTDRYRKLLLPQTLGVNRVFSQKEGAGS